MSVWVEACCQWLQLLALAWLRARLLRLPLPLLEWMVERYRFAWLGRLQCDTNRCLFAYWGRYTVGPLLPGWSLIVATHRTTGRKHYALRAQWPRLALSFGYQIKASHAEIRLADSVRGVKFRVVGKMSDER